MRRDDRPDSTEYLVREDSGIASVGDLSGKRLSAGLVNSINQFYTQT